MEICESGVFGFIVGDALGVPHEFKSRDLFRRNPVTDMTGYGTHNQPPGTWSDDSSLTLCLLQSLINGYDLADISKKFICWYKEGKHTPFGNVFDIGISTRSSIEKLTKGVNPALSGGIDEHENGNGSLMRVLPLIYYLKNFDDSEKFRIISEVSSITHAHKRSVIACSIYVEMGIQLLKTNDKKKALTEMRSVIKNYFCDDNELVYFQVVLNDSIESLHEKEIKSTGYVIHTLEASFWCFLTGNNYKESVLKAVNLGLDTDTTAAVTGGLSGIYYGYESIPEKWINMIPGKEMITNLCRLFNDKIFK